jgi:predicted secreted hydrolase
MAKVLQVAEARTRRIARRLVAWAGQLLARVAYITCITFVAPLSLAADFPEVVPGYAITFPADEGSHPTFRTEWWYVTGWLTDARGLERGFQITFFRSRPGVDESNPSRFAPTQLLFAHAAISDPTRGGLVRAERSARAGFGLAEAAEGELAVHIDEWALRKEGGVYRISIVDGEFAFDLELRATQSPILQGEQGFSQKSPDPGFASYYYSLPQLRTKGALRIGAERHSVQGTAWFDHEWSNRLLDEESVGWDWIGLNLDDGSTVAAARVRDRSGEARWAGGTWRTASSLRAFEPHQVEWTARRRWRSPRTGIEYPIEWRVKLGDRTLVLTPLMDDQENDTRGSTGSIYWEGAVRVLDESGARVGKGYLELTGYARR